MTATMTRHAKDERFERLSRLVDAIGVGNEYERFIDEEEDVIRCIMDNGMLIILGATNKKMITGYMMEVNQVVSIYKRNGRNHVPEKIYKVVCENKRKYGRKKEYWT